VGTRTVHVSDLSGKQADEKNLGKLIIHEHPSYATPITLEVLAEEIGDLPESESYVRLEYIPPGETRGQSVILPLERFDKLAQAEDMNAVLLRAIAETHQERGQAAPLPARRRKDGGSRRGRTDYASIAHAGEPHRGRITDAEKRIVRDRLDEVNARATREGYAGDRPGRPEVAGALWARLRP
jgi:hypothetical protein